LRLEGAIALGGERVELRRSVQDEDAHVVMILDRHHIFGG
jgi:hypothetical protein